MKKLYSCMLLLLGVAPAVLAMDEGGDGAYIPSRWELARMGYYNGRYNSDQYSHELYGYDHTRETNLAFNGWRPISKPTQAYYGRGYVVYYGFQAVPTRALAWNPETYYAFGHPADYYQKLMPVSVGETNIDKYAVLVGKRYISFTEYGNMVASDRPIAISRVEAVAKRSEPLPAIGEKKKDSQH